jgi:hypothetical protein
MKSASEMTGINVLRNEPIVFLSKPDIAVSFGRVMRLVTHFPTKKAGAPIPLRYFGDPAVSERPNRLSVPPLRMV